MLRKLLAFAMTVFLMATGAAHAMAAPAEAPVGTVAQETVEAMFFNVGKADSALCIVGDERYLIDTGTNDSANAMLEALAFYGVTKLNGVIVTHIDSDHVGGLKALLKSGIAVERLYAATIHNAKSLEKHPVYKQSVKREIPMTWLNAGDEIAVNGNSRFSVLGPLTRDMTDENNNSLVLWLETPQGAMLFTGDMELDEEETLLKAGLIRRADVLKVGHHGAGDASGEGLIYTVKPQIAVISTDTEAEADTPDASVIARLWNIGAEIFETQKATCCVLVTLTEGKAVGRLVNYATQ